jgi:hypothetical protein
MKNIDNGANNNGRKYHATIMAIMARWRGNLCKYPHNNKM